MTKLIVDGIEVDVPAEYTLLQACEAAGAEIPRFCFHERLSIAGNCRMCLVEVKGAPKPVASCAWGVRDCRPGPNGEPPVVSTKSPMVKKAREGRDGVPAHQPPARLPDLRPGRRVRSAGPGDGLRRRRDPLPENKRAVEDKYIGPLVKTKMNRCIHCTRCIRFTTEVAGVPDLGAIGRGEDMEITTYLEQRDDARSCRATSSTCARSARSTSKPYEFKARPWELTKTESIDVMDARRLGHPRRRARPRSDAHPAAHQRGGERGVDLRQDPPCGDGLRRQRLDRPYRPRRRPAARRRPGSEAFAPIAGQGEGTRARSASAPSPATSRPSRRCSRSSC